MSNTTTQKTRPNYSPEVRQRAVRMVLDHQGRGIKPWQVQFPVWAIGFSGDARKRILAK